jgi:hypothetical protein
MQAPRQFLSAFTDESAHPATENVDPAAQQLFGSRANRPWLHDFASRNIRVRHWTPTLSEIVGEIASLVAQRSRKRSSRVVRWDASPLSRPQNHI